MGADQSVPARPTPNYQPDFLTAHVRTVSKQLAPQKAGSRVSSSGFGSDGLALTQAKQAQSAISGSPEKAAPRVVNAPPAYGSDTFMHNHLHSLSQQKVQQPQQQPLERPKVGVDSKLMTEQRRLAQLANHVPRNKFDLMAAPGTPEKIHQTADGYETAFAQETKKMCPGPVQDKGRTFGPEQGLATNLKQDDIYIQFNKGVQGELLPKKAPKAVQQWQGIRPDGGKKMVSKKKIAHPTEDYAGAEIKDNLQKIRQANVTTPLPAPQFVPDAFMLQFSKDTAEIVDPKRYGGMADLPPANAYDNSADFSAAVTPAKADAAAAKTPKSGSESYMSTFAKQISTFTPSKLLSSREAPKAAEEAPTAAEEAPAVAEEAPKTEEAPKAAEEDPMAA